MYNEFNDNYIDDYLNNIKNVEGCINNDITFVNKKLLINILLLMLLPQDSRPSAKMLLKIISDNKLKIDK